MYKITTNFTTRLEANTAPTQTMEQQGLINQQQHNQRIRTPKNGHKSRSPGRGLKYISPTKSSP